MPRYVIRITEQDLKRSAATAAERDAEHAARMVRDARDRRFLDVDASDWRDMAEFYEAALPLLGIAELPDRSPGALVKAMVQGRTRAVEPPYTLRVGSIAALPRCRRPWPGDCDSCRSGSATPAGPPRWRVGRSSASASSCCRTAASGS